MCGIFAYKGNGNATEIVFNGLKKLEYRGYDSWGMAFKEDSNIKIIKRVGRIEDFKEKLSSKSHFAIGHTRWATHGSVTEANAHPHLSNNKKIAVIHNGIIENYAELKKFLIKNGYKFISQTDTEVIPNLIQYNMKNNNFEDAVKNTLKKLEGSFAIAIINKDSENIVAARKMSPMVLGISKDGFFISSDIPAFLEHTNKVISLDDNEMTIINNKIKIINFMTNKEIKKEQETINLDFKESKKGKFRHYIIKEISEQEESIMRAIEQDQDFIKNIANQIENAFGVFFIGCGTSYHACLSASYLFSKIAKKHINVVLASEFRNYRHFLTENTLVIAVSQSGETADVLDAIRVAKEKHSRIISIVNVPGSSLTKLSDKVIMMNAGQEVSVLSTKSYTSQLAILSLLAYASINEFEKGKGLIKKTASYVNEIISKNLNKLENLADMLKHKKDIFLIGRSLGFPTALEGALKIKEVSYIHAEGLAGGELKHGTLALIEKNVPVIVVSTDETKKDILNNALEIKARGGYIIGF
ncbi:MAG: glutamine--fructose-6-phosphate transaminase (isomerizing), partial [Nanoarchaeota archaeon]|nr:glutamine--fructose-6-phosphate transaminase (isomerizing) [Nanoarchaeota archaeon]